MTITITWKDGAVDRAATYEGILARVARKAHDDRIDIRVALAKRAWFWSDGRVAVDPENDDAETIIHKLVDAGMLASVKEEN